jgi:hypothetical protein
MRVPTRQETMMSDAAQQLSGTLRAALPAEFESLSDTDLSRLDTILKAAAAGRAAALGTAIGGSLDYIPRLMRPAVKKALGL